MSIRIVRMLHNNELYDTYYGVGLLDDLHNYFPDLLYNTRRFNNIQDVLNYIRSITQYRFDRFSSAQAMRQQPQSQQPQSQQPQSQQPQRRTWHRRHQQSQTTRAYVSPRNWQQTQAAQTQVQRTDNYRNILRNPSTFYTALPTLNTPIQQTQPTLFPLTPAPITTTTFDFTLPATTTAEPYDIENATALLTLLGLFATPTTTIPLTPVVVAPSREVINHATSVDTISEEPIPSGVCVICQENFAFSNTIRTITHCGHAFHDSCILRHFETSVRCPTCRFDIREYE